MDDTTPMKTSPIHHTPSTYRSGDYYMYEVPDREPEQEPYFHIYYGDEPYACAATRDDSWMSFMSNVRSVERDYVRFLRTNDLVPR